MRKLLNIKTMRTMLPSILMLLATGWFAACSQDEHAENLGSGDTPISFGGAVDDDKEQVARSRASLEDENIETFTLWGYKNMAATDGESYSFSETKTVFNAYTMTYTAGSAGSTSDNTDGWHYVGGGQTIKYWDNDAKAYRFMAYAPQNSTSTSDATNVTVTSDAYKMVFTIPANADTEDAIKNTRYFSKMWFSTGNLAEYPNRQFGKPVQMEFVKPFVRVRFMFIDHEGKTLTVDSPIAKQINKSQISFAPADGSDIINRGYVTVTYPLGGTATTETYSYSRYDTQGGSVDVCTITLPYEDTQVLIEDAANLKKWYTVLPSSTQGAYKLTVFINGASRTAIVPAEFMQWQVGYQYTYVFKLSAAEAQFQPELFLYDKWQAGYSGTTTW